MRLLIMDTLERIEVAVRAALTDHMSTSYDDAHWYMDAAHFRNLRQRHDRTAVTQCLGLTTPVLESWMQTYTRVRNICAHHGRLWNAGLGVYPVIPTSRTVP